MTGIRNEKELLQALSSLPREVAPGNDVWPQVLGRISEGSQNSKSPGNRNRWWPAAVAASLMVVLLGGLVLKPPPGPEGAGKEFTILPQNPVASESPITTPLSNRLMVGANTVGEHEYQAAFREFLSFPIDLQSPAWPGMETIGSGWVTLQQAEMELALALRQEPKNRVLNSRMAAVRARQLDLLQQIAAMEMASRRNTT